MVGQYKPFWLDGEKNLVVLDQTRLPFEEAAVTLKTAENSVTAIKDMTVRGAGVIGNVAAFGVYLAARESKELNEIREKSKKIRESRPTAVNLMWAVDRMLSVLEKAEKDLVEVALEEAIKISDEDVERSKEIGRLGCDRFEKILKEKERGTLNILTHCNAGWLAIVDDGTALAPIYEAKRRGIDVHVWVDETRPRNQGANLTAWELSKAGIKHTIIADNTGGFLMQQGFVDVCITGADRVSRQGDVANKIGTYLKALSAKDNNIPFYVALPASTFDFEIIDGVKDIPVETRSEDEVKYMRGVNSKGEVDELLITPKESPALNYGFDITPNRLVSGLITERGIIKAKLESIEDAFKDLI